MLLKEISGIVVKQRDFVIPCFQGLSRFSPLIHMNIKWGVIMHQRSFQFYRFVHIIFFWLIGLYFGMLVFSYFQTDFHQIIFRDPVAPILLFSVLSASLIPLLLVVFFIRTGFFLGHCFIILFKAFFYGLTVMSYVGPAAIFLIFSQTTGCVLLLLLSFFNYSRKDRLDMKAFSVFIFADLFLILFDYFVICPLYS